MPLHPPCDSHPGPTPSCSNIPADIPSTPATRPQPSSHSGPARHRPHRNPVRYVHHRRTTVRDCRTPRSATLRWGRPAGPTSALPIQTSAGGHGVNYDGPEAAPATESGSGPALPSMEHGHVLGDGLCTPCGKAPAAEGPTAREPCLEKHCAVYRARYAAGNAAGKIYGGANVDAKRRRARASSRRRQAKRREAVFASAAASVRRSRAGRPAAFLC